MKRAVVSNYWALPALSPVLCLPAENKNSLLLSLFPSTQKFDTVQVKSDKMR